MLLNETNPFRPVARRVKAPITQQNAQSTESLQNHLSHFKLHNLSQVAHSDETHPVLKMDMPAIPVKQDKIPSPVQPMPNQKVNTSLPKQVVMSRDALFRAVGYHNTKHLLKHIHKLGTGSVQIQNLPTAEDITPGSTASLHSAKRNTDTTMPPCQYSDYGTWILGMDHLPLLEG